MPATDLPPPLVSVVMSVYNGAERLPATLDSILSQEGVDFEFIVIDDGSTDDSGRILDEYATRDARLRVIHQQNTGLTRALIRGCAEARGEFIARQDCGDVSLPGRLAKQVAVMQAFPDLSFTSCCTEYRTEKGEFLYLARGKGKAYEPCAIIDLTQPYGVLDGPSHHGSVMFRRNFYEMVGGYREDFYYGQDWDLWYRLAESGHFQMLADVLYQARMGVKDISMNNKARQEMIGKQSLRALKLRMAGMSERPALEAAALIRPDKSGGLRSVSTWRGSYFMGECLRRNGNHDAALNYFLRAVQENPLHLKSWVRLLQTRFG